jgi:hypothetical protein
MALQRWNNLTPTIRKKLRAYVIAEVKPKRLLRSGRVVVSPDPWLGVWSAAGKRLVTEEGATLLELVPGTQDVALVRMALRPDAPSAGVSRDDYVWTFERWSLEGERRTCVEIPAPLSMGWLVSMEFPKSYKGSVAKIRCGYEDAPYSFYVRDAAPAGVYRSAAELVAARSSRPARAAKPTTATKPSRGRATSGRSRATARRRG